MSSQFESEENRIQIESKRRRVQASYRSLIRDLEDHKHEWSEPQDENDLYTSLEKASNLFKSVKSANESVLDSKLLYKSMEIVSKRSRTLKIGESYVNANQFLDQIIFEFQRVGFGLDWGRLGRHAWQFSSRIPISDFISGPLNATALPQKTTRRNVQTLDALSVQDTLSTRILPGENISESNNITQNVVKIHEILSRYNKLRLVELITNPNSFAESVENLFYVSFLVNDGKAQLIFDDDRQLGPLIQLYQQSGSGSETGSEANRDQCVFSLSMQDWENCIRVCKIKEPIIQSRGS